MKLQHKIVTLATLGLFSCANAFAELTTSAGVGVISDSNLLRQVDDDSDVAISVTPRLEFTRETGGGAQQYGVSYDGDFRQYSDNDNFDFTAHDLNLTADLRHSNRLASKFSAIYYNGIEEAGSTDQSTEGFTELTDFEWRGFTAQGSYGTRQSTGQVVLVYAHNQRRYEKNQQEFRDSNENEISARFFYRRNDVSRLLLEASFADVEYQNQELRNDASTDRASLLAGLEWELGAVTTGVAKIGFQRRTFDNSRFEDRSDLAYSLEMIWTPFNSTRFNAAASRKVAAAAQVDSGDLIRNSFLIGAQYALSDRTLIVGEYEYAIEDIAEARTDNRQRISIGGEYFFRSWLKFEARYFYDERTSDIESFEFDSNTIMFSAVMTFDT